METANLNLNQKYSYADYLTWIDDIRRELFNGIIKMMTPAPSSRHQEISFHLSRQFGNYLIHRKCKGFAAPSDVRLPHTAGIKEDNLIFTVVQPDLYIVCDPSKIDERGCLGPPDLIVEIVSSSNSRRDVKEKFELYEQHGVKEYWIVNPNDQNVLVFLLNESGKYQFSGMYAHDDQIPVSIFAGDLSIDLKEVFID